MSLREGVRVALASLLASKLRSILTMLGIIIGVGSVIALLAIGQGMQASVREQIQRNGSNLVTVMPGAQTAGGVSQGAGSAQTLTYEDALALASDGGVPAAAAISPELNGRYQLQVGSVNTNAQVVGAVPAYQTVHNATVATGDFIGDGQVSSNAGVVVLGANLATTLFPDGNAVGQRVMISQQSFQVVGVLAAKGGGGFGSVDEQAFVPITTALQRLAGNRAQGATTTGRVISSIAIQAVDEASTTAVTNQVTEVLRERHRITNGVDDFRFFNQADLLASANQITGLITLFLGAVAGISLLVGGIGIMNIMLVSVTERTREIGIRKAIGARERDILGQFLIEAILLSLTGGALGILLGVGVALAVNAAGQRTDVAPWSILLAASVAMAIGVFFGFYPARRAARLNPIEALRYE
ncbi:MAG: ABC transporter permease [Chloroflexi bacterium]|nr:ABC transporter permease [Chloroflexota bacterium]